MKRRDHMEWGWELTTRRQKINGDGELIQCHRLPGTFLETENVCGLTLTHTIAEKLTL